MDINIPLHVIGLVRTGHADLENVPIQAGINRAERGVIEIDQAYRDGLDGLSGFDFAWLITWLHGQAGVSGPAAASGPAALRQVPFLLRPPWRHHRDRPGRRAADHQAGGGEATGGTAALRPGPRLAEIKRIAEGLAES